MSAWADEVRARPIAALAPALGLLPRRSGSWAPCPACRAEDRGDSRGPIGIAASGLGWRCHRCGARGGGLDLLAYAVLGSVPGRSDKASWARIGAAASERGLAPSWTGEATSPPPRAYAPAPAPVPRARLRAPGVAEWWAGLRPAGPEVRAWIRARGSDPDRVDVRQSAGPWPAWVPRWAQAGRPAVLACYDERAEVVSVRLRAIGPVRGPKATGPSGRHDRRSGGEPYSAAGAVLMSPGALGGRPRTWVVVEGEPDWMAWASRVGEDVGVVGIGSGWWSQAIADRIAPGAVVLLATHADPAGEEYARRVEATLPGRVCARTPPPAGGDWADAAVRGWTP